ncbi:hypothetical protein HUK80_07640 [Flavobacterium sp. MAH-1]|uniref:Uncharacterized protein n=1 Tax=Flavobacterium agri TaxID=2743471 RepID=A0A7Y8Y2M5_9FLAO|nr:hypothetical protein [Flavobacterium agri]NUY80759.1 hypothetical protein [Flavobacterium agri]NYA70783.1 hypothetical protein [Flavobacterium agri]
MKKMHFSFLGFSFERSKFVVLLLFWMFFICFIWPFVAHSYWFISVMISSAIFFAVLGVFQILRWIMVLLHLARASFVITVIYYVLTLLFALPATYIYSWFVPMSVWSFLGHYAVHILTPLMLISLVLGFSREDTEETYSK